MNGNSGQPTGGESWGRFPFWLVNSGVWAALKPADRAVFGVIAAHTGRDWASRPSLTRIADLAGLKRGTVCVAIQRLEAGGIIDVERGGGRGNANTYRLVINGLRRGTVSEGETVCPDGDKRSAPTAETVCAHGGNGLRRPDGNRTDRTEQNRPAAADGVRGELARHGISEPKLSELASLAGLTRGMVRDLAARIGKAKNPGGLLVTLIEREGPQLVEAARSKAEARTRREAERQRNRQAEATARAEQEAEQARRLELVNGLSDAELAWRTDAALAAAGPFHGNRWRELVRRLGYRGAVLQNRGLRDAVCRPTGHT